MTRRGPGCYTPWTDRNTADPASHCPLPKMMFRTFLLPIALTALLPAQDATAPPGEPSTPTATTASAAPQDPKLAWPRDAERLVCSVGGRDFTLRDLVTHISQRHYPGMVALMNSPSSTGYFQSPRLAEWVRAFADVKTLELAAAARELDYEQVRDTLGEALKKQFNEWLDAYADRRARAGTPLELTQDRINLLLSDFQRDEGLRTEVQGWLDAMVPEVPLEATGKIRDFYEDHPEYFGGVLTIAQILVEHRDPLTLELKTGEAREAALAKLADVRARLEPDGSNFEEVARLLSDDRRTARDGGRLDGVKRFDPRLPAAICRAAWSLRDGEVSAPFESPYGTHIVKRVAYRHLYYIVFTDKIKPAIAQAMRQNEQENLIFRAREQFGAQLRY